MKKYELELEHLEDGIWISEIFSKGHHNKDEFKIACIKYYEQYMGEIGEDDTHSEGIEDNKVKQIYGKKVGWFEENEYRGWTLSYSLEPKKSYFPMTIIYLQ